MRDYDELVNALRGFVVCLSCPCETPEMCNENDCMVWQAADAIEELLAFAHFVAREAIDTGDNDGVSAEILCRKLHKLGLTETDGELWTLPDPPKEVV